VNIPKSALIFNCDRSPSNQSRVLLGAAFSPPKNFANHRSVNSAPTIKKTEDFGGALKFLCYSLPLSKGFSYLPIEADERFRLRGRNIEENVHS
jgi:hypothetical protein